MKKEILLVEDEKAIQLLISYNLEKLKYKTIIKETAEEGLEFLEMNESLPQIIITDVLLPGMNGINFCKLVKSNPSMSHIPVIILSSVDFDFYREGAEKAGADYFLTKPFRIKDFINLIQNLLS